ncbi:hypothetical protein U0L90_03135 [Flavobacteriaceae sp. LMIT009]
MKRTLFTLIILVGFLSCKNEKKEEPVKEELEVIEEKSIRKFPKLEPRTSDMNLIFEDGYLFDEKIQLDEISVENIGENLYDIIFYFNDSSDFEMLENYKISFNMQPKDPSKLMLEKDRNAKRKKVGAKIKIGMLDNMHAAIIDSVELAPKEFSRIKVHLYNNEAGALNDNFLILRDIVFY